MAELSAGKQPAKRFQPSRLRHEVQVESTDDESALEAGPVQAPDSQTVVPETQLERHQDNESNYGDPLSPSSVALLDRNTSKKSSQTTHPTFFPVKLFSKESPFNGSISAPASSVGFSFGQPKKAASKTPPKAAAATLQLVTTGPPAEHHKNDVVNPFVSLLSFPSITAADSVMQQSPDADHGLTEDTSTPKPKILTVAASAQDEMGERKELHDAISDLPPSAQPSNDPIGIAKKSRKKQAKKGKKSILGQPRGAPWPPRSSVTAPVTIEPPPTEKTVQLQRSPVHGASPPIEPELSQMIQNLDKSLDVVGVPSITHEEVIDYAAHRADVAKAQQYRFDTQESDASFPVGQQTISVKHDASPERAIDYIPNTCTIAHHQPSLRLESQSSADFVADGRTSVALDAPMEQSIRHQSPAARPKARQSNLQQDPHTGNHEQHFADVNSHPPHVTKSAATKEHLPEPNDHALHGTYSQNRPSRVEKTQKKRRVSSGTQHPMPMTLVRNRGPVVQDDFDKMVDSLREAHHAQKFRKDHDLATQTKHFEEVKALLHDQLNQCSITIVEWKEKYDALHESTKQLREKAKSNQRYVSGLQKDHEKLQKSAITFQDECKKTLQQKIVEVELEKQSLQRALEATLDSLAKGQRTLKATTDELYVRFIISESKRKHLVENLSRQVILYEEEKTRRKELETKLLPSFQSVQRQLGDRSTQLIEKLERLQTSVDGVASELGQGPGVQECLDALRKLQDAPFLMMKDVEKAERMLRFMHEGLCSKFESVVQSIDIRTHTAGQIENFIGKQLQDLRSEMLKFDELAAESREAKESRDVLSRNLKAERHQIQKLEEQLETARQNEETLESRKAQLERQVADLNDNAKLHKAISLDNGQAVTDLQERIKEVEHEHSVAQAEIERLQRNIQERDQKSADYDASVSMLKEESRKLSEQLKQKVKSSDMAQLRNEIELDIQQCFIEKESNYRNNVQQLTIERDELQALVQQHDQKIEAAKEKCEDARKDVRDVRSELEFIRKEKMELEAKCNILERTVQDQLSGASELSGVKERLEQKSEELRGRTEQFAELQRTFTNLESHKTNLQVLCEQQQVEISQHPAAIESLRQEVDSERQEQQRSTQAAIQLAHKKTLALKNEREDLHAKLEQVQTKDSKLKNRQAALVLERDSLRHRIAELELGNEDSATQLRSVQEGHADKLREYDENIDTLRRHHERSESARKEAEAKLQLQKTEHLKKIEFDRQKYESIVQRLQEDLNMIKSGKTSIRSGQQEISPSSGSLDTFARDLHNINSGKGRKKVNRGNNSVLNISGTPGTLVETFPQHTNTSRRVPAREHSDTLFDEASQDQDGSDRLINSHVVSIVDPAAEQVEDTHEIVEMLMSFEEETEKPARVSLKGLQRQVTNTTDQSSLSASIPSDELAQLREESQDIRRPSTPVLHGRVQVSDTQRSSQERVPETPSLLDNASGSTLNSSESYDRPRSQANTASRLMPPPGSKSQHHSHHGISPAIRIKPTDSRTEDSKPGQVSRTGTDSLATSAYQSTSSPHHTSRVSDPTGIERSGRTSSTMEHSKGRKRQGTSERDESPKRQRTSSQSLPAHPSSGSRSRSSHPSRPSASPALSSQSRVQPPSSTVARRLASRTSSSSNRDQPRTQQSSASRSSTTTTAYHVYGRHQTRSKTQEIERFEQELRGG